MGKMWTEEEIRFVQGHYREMTDKEISVEMPGRTVEAVRGRRQQEGWSKKGINWPNIQAPGKAALYQLYSDYQRRSRKKGFEWSLGIKQFRELTQRACHYCGIAPAQKSGGASLNGAYIYNGLDRLDNAKGYELSNVVPCCKRCNTAKNDMTYNEFYDWIRRLHQHCVNPATARLIITGIIGNLGFRACRESPATDMDQRGAFVFGRNDERA